MSGELILVTGASGKLGAYVVTRLVQLGRRVAAWSGRTNGEVAGVGLRPVDLTDSLAVEAEFKKCAPRAVIHCAALSAVSDCFRAPDLAHTVNCQATGLLARLAPRIVYTSTDLVFDGEGAPYCESQEPRPLSIYAKSKWAGERAILEQPNAVVARVSLLYGPAILGGGGFFEQQLDKLTSGGRISLFHDEWRTPLALDEAASGLVALADSEETGIFHLGGPERMSRYEMGVTLANFLGVGGGQVDSTSQKSINFSEERPTDVSLCCERAKRLLGWSPSSFRDGLNRLIGKPPAS